MTSVKLILILLIPIASGSIHGSEIPHTVLFAKILMGYDSTRETFTENYCTDYRRPDGIIVGNPTEPSSAGWVQSTTNANSSLTLRKNMSFQEMLSVLTGSLEIGIKMQALTVEGAFTYASRNAASKYNETYTFTFDFAGVSLTPQEGGRSVLSPFGRRVKRRDFDHIIRACGDEYVSQIDYGAKFLVNLTIEYASEEDKKFFEGMLFIDIQDLASVRGQLRYKYEEVSRRARVSIDAFQLGGEPFRLSQLPGADVLACSMSNLHQCMDSLQSILAYGRSLAQQFNIESMDKLAPITYHTSPYPSDLGLAPAPLSEIQKSLLKRERRSLMMDVLETMQDISRAQFVLASYELSGMARKHLEDLIEKALDNNKTRNDALASCYQSPRLECICDNGIICDDGIIASARKNAAENSYNRQHLNVPPKSFQTWCDYHNRSYYEYEHSIESGELMTRAFKDDLITVHALLMLSGVRPTVRHEAKRICSIVEGREECRDVTIARDVYQCQDAELALISRSSLDLTGQPIGSLKPLAAFGDVVAELKLQNLSSRHDLGFISMFERLRSLNLNGFKSPRLSLGLLPYVRVLHLEGSLIDDLEFLGNFPTLEELWMRDTEVLDNFNALTRASKLRRAYFGTVVNTTPLEYIQTIEALPFLERIWIKKSSTVPCDHPKIACYE